MNYVDGAVVTGTEKNRSRKVLLARSATVESSSVPTTFATVSTRKHDIGVVYIAISTKTMMETHKQNEI